MYKSIRNTVSLLLLFLATGRAFPQTEFSASVTSCPSLTIVANSSEPQSPAERAKYSLRVRMSVTNVGGKDIVAAVTRIHVRPLLSHAAENPQNNLGSSKTPEQNQKHVEDYFYSEHSLGAGAKAEWETFMPPLPSPESTSVIPEVGISVEFIQFSDGTTWGEKSVGEKLNEEHRVGLKKLSELLTVYRENGGDKFLEALLKADSSDLIFLLQARYRRTGDILGVLKDVEAKYRNAEANFRTLARQDTLRQ